MQVLLYVMALLMLLLVMTAAKVNFFEHAGRMHQSVVRYMETFEREPYQQLAADFYDRITLKSRAANPAKSSKIQGTSRLSLAPILNEDVRNKNPEVYQQTRTLLKQLMIQLFSQARFYQQLAQSRSSFLDELIDELQKAAEQTQEKESLEGISGLSQLEIFDPDLKYAFFLMLQGVPVSLGAPSVHWEQEEKEATSKLHSDTLDLTAEEEEEAQAESDEGHAAAGLASLQDYLTSKDSPKIRVFLAPKALLLAIYGDGIIVDRLLESRHQLFNAVNRDPSQKQALSEQFQEDFSSQGQASAFNAILDFSVSRTQPRD